MKFIMGRILALSLALLGIAAAPAPAQLSSVTVDLTDYAYQDVTINGLYAQTTLWIPMESNWALENNVHVSLSYVASPLLNPDAAVVSVLTNSQEVSSFRPIGNGKENRYEFDIPLDMIRREDRGFILGLSAYLKTTTGPCENLNIPGQWLTLKNDTRITFVLGPRALPPALENLPHAIIADGPISQRIPAVFVLPAKSDAATREVAAQVAAGLATQIPYGEYPLGAATSETLTDDQKFHSNLVFIGSPDQFDLPELRANLVVPYLNGRFLDNGQPVPAGQAVIQILPSPWNTRANVLFVSGTDADGMHLARDVFKSSAVLASLRGDAVILSALPDLATDASLQPWLQNQTTFNQLGATDSTVSGLGNIRLEYFFRPPQGWVLADSSQLVLHLDLSPALRLTGIPPAVFVNDTFIGSPVISPQEHDSWIPIDLPVRSLNFNRGDERLRDLNVRIEFPGAVFENECKAVDSRNMWATIYGDSYFVTPHSYVQIPDLQAFPYPFVADQTESSVVIVVPDNPTSKDLSDAITIAAVLGQYKTRDVNLRILQTSETTPATAGKSHLIVLGTPDRQPLVDRLRKQPDAIAQTGLHDFIRDKGEGVLDIAASPWDSTFQALYVFGFDQAAYNLALTKLYTDVPPVSTSGLTALVKPDNTIFMLVLLNSTKPVIPPELATPNQPSGTQPAVPTGIVTTVQANDNSTPNREPNTVESLILGVTAALVVVAVIVSVLRIFARNPKEP